MSKDKRTVNTMLQLITERGTARQELGCEKEKVVRLAIENRSLKEAMGIIESDRYRLEKENAELERQLETAAAEILRLKTEVDDAWDGRHVGGMVQGRDYGTPPEGSRQ